MNKITKEHLVKLGIATEWEEPLNRTFEKFGIDTRVRQAAFIGQCKHESKFNILVENLNYSKEALCRIWPKRFPTIESAEQYHRQPEKIANKVYANRMGNGDEKSGEGWLYRGRGLIQLTGKNNYASASTGLNVGDLLIAYPEVVATPLYACLTAGWFWNENKLNELADKKDWVALTKKINGGMIGLEERIKYIEESIRILQ